MGEGEREKRGRGGWSKQVGMVGDKRKKGEGAVLVVYGEGKIEFYGGRKLKYYGGQRVSPNRQDW